MTLVEFVPFLFNPDSLITKYQLDEDFEAAIYMKEKIDIDSDIYIFSYDETDEDLLFEKEGVNHVQLFSLNHAMDLLDELDLRKKGLSNLYIAKRLVSYRLNDA